ncbi:hypothetical protein QOT17_004562 [Balamuthia mandrillaris]
MEEEATMLAEPQEEAQAAEGAPPASEPNSSSVSATEAEADAEDERKRELAKRKEELAKRQQQARVKRGGSPPSSAASGTKGKEKADEEATPASTPAPAPKPKVIREEQVQNALKFLTHPKVQSSPLGKRIAFLEHKGLNDDEISEALKRANVSSAEIKAAAAATAATTSVAAPVSSSSLQSSVPLPSQQQVLSQQPALPPRPAVAPPPPPPPKSAWKAHLLTAVLCLGAGSALPLLAMKYNGMLASSKRDNNGAGNGALLEAAAERKAEAEEAQKERRMKQELDAFRSSQTSLNNEMKQAFLEMKQMFEQSRSTNTQPSQPSSSSPLSPSPSSPSTTSQTSNENSVVLSREELVALKSELKALKAMVHDQRMAAATIPIPENPISKTRSTPSSGGGLSSSLPSWMMERKTSAPTVSKSQDTSSSGGVEEVEKKEEGKDEDKGKQIEQKEEVEQNKTVSPSPLKPYQRKKEALLQQKQEALAPPPTTTTDVASPVSPSSERKYSFPVSPASVAVPWPSSTASSTTTTEASSPASSDSTPEQQEQQAE